MAVNVNPDSYKKQDDHPIKNDRTVRLTLSDYLKTGSDLTPVILLFLTNAAHLTNTRSSCAPINSKAPPNLPRMSIQPKKEYGEIEESRRTFSGFGSSKGIGINDCSQNFKLSQNLNVENDELRRSARLSNKQKNNNLGRGINIAERSGEHARKTPSNIGHGSYIAKRPGERACKTPSNHGHGINIAEHSCERARKSPVNFGHGINIAEHSGDRQNDGARKTTIASKWCLWSHEEDQALKALVNTYGETKWSYIARYLNSKTGKQCRERWHNHLRPNIKEQPWTEEEEKLLIEMHSVCGNKWVQIAKYIPGRTENAIKNHWNSTKRKNCRRNQLFIGPRPKSLLQEYIETVDKNSQERSSASKCIATVNLNSQERNSESNAWPRKHDISKEESACIGLSLSQPGMPDEREISYTGTNNLYQSDMAVAGNAMYACNNPSHYVNPNRGGERFYTGTNPPLNLYQIMGFNSDEVNPVGSFTELLGLGFNMYAPQFAVPPSSWYTFTPNVGPVYFGDDIGSSSSHAVTNEPPEDYYKNMAMVSTEKNACVDTKGKGKMLDLLG